MTLSSRGTKLLQPPPETAYLAAFARVAEDPWHPDDNPQGPIQLAVAENVHTWAELEPVMRRLVADSGFAGDVPHYGDFRGHVDFRRALLAYMRRHVFLDRGRPLGEEAWSFSEDHLLVTNGCGPALEHLVFALCDPGDAVLTPAPIYPGFLLDVGGRAQARLITVPLEVEGEPRLDPVSLDSALSEARDAGVQVRALLLCQPHNPLGVCLSAAEVELAVRWCVDRGLHLISDEIYAASVFAPGLTFTSATAYLARFRDWGRDHLHVLYGMSKDFGLSGFRVGTIYSSSPELHRALDSLTYFCGCSSLPQYLLTAVLEDEAGIDRYLEANRNTLRRLYRLAVGAAQRWDIPHLSADSGFFLWLDLRRWLSESVSLAEEELWSALLDEAGVFVTPGLSCRAPQPGFFRLCFAACPEEALEVGVERIGRFLARSPKA